MVDPSASVLGRMEDGIDDTLLDRVLDGTRTGSGDGFLDRVENTVVREIDLLTDAGVRW